MKFNSLPDSTESGDVDKKRFPVNRMHRNILEIVDIFTYY